MVRSDNFISFACRLLCSCLVHDVCSESVYRSYKRSVGRIERISWNVVIDSKFEKSCWHRSVLVCVLKEFLSGSVVRCCSYSSIVDEECSKIPYVQWNARSLRLLLEIVWKLLTPAVSVGTFDGSIRISFTLYRINWLSCESYDVLSK